MNPLSTDIKILFISTNKLLLFIIIIIIIIIGFIVFKFHSLYPLVYSY
jgi:hypothetical protein